jgi:hypothetical protein
MKSLLPPVNTRMREYTAVLLLIIFVCLIFQPLFTHLVCGDGNSVPYTDHPAHNAFAADMRQRQVISMPHPLYHAAVIVAEQIREIFQSPPAQEPDARIAIALAAKDKQGPELTAINRRYAPASITILLLFQIFVALVLYAHIRKNIHPRTWIGTVAAVLISLGLMVTAPIALYVNVDHQFYFGYIGINVWHSPTVLVAKPWALITFAMISAMLIPHSPIPLASSSVDGKSQFTKVWMTAAIVIVGALAKPSFLIALIPAAVLFAAYQRFARKTKVSWKSLICALIVPAVAVLLWQGHIYSQLTGGSRAKFAPFATLSSMSNHLGPKFFLSILFPIAGYLLAGSATECRSRLNLGWLTFICGAMLTYLITESRRTSHGNFLWSAQLAVFVLFTQTACCVIATTRERWHIASKRNFAVAAASICAAVFLAHVGYGVAYYTHLMRSPSNTMLLYK